MENRAVLILGRPTLPGNGSSHPAWRFGERDLLAHIVAEIRPVAQRLVLLPGGEPPAESYRKKHLAGVELGSAGGSLLQRIAEGARLAESAEHIALLTDDLPLLTCEWLERLFEALSPDTDVVCTETNGSRLPLLAVNRRPVIAGAAEISDPDRPVQALWAGYRIKGLPVPAECGVATVVDSPESYRAALARLGFCDGAQPPITLELYGNLRIKTGCAGLPIHAGTVGAAYGALQSIYPDLKRWLPESEKLAAHLRFSINGNRVTTDLDYPLRDGDHVILFSATVGG